MAYPLPSSEEMNSFDRTAISAGSPALELMERAGAGIAEKIIDHLTQSNMTVGSATITIFSGSGNNGGDGVIVYKKLREASLNARLVVIQAENYSPELTSQLKHINAFGTVSFFPSTPQNFEGDSIDRNEIVDLIRSSTVIVDCVLGTGQSKAPHGNVESLLTIIQEELAITSSFVIAADIPSGVSGTTGEVFFPHIPANKTISIQAVKRGLVQFPASDVCGMVETIDIRIGTPRSGCFFNTLDPNDFPFPCRPTNAHKASQGKVLIVGGSEHMTGAPILSSLGALHTGAGYVFLGCGEFTSQRTLPLEVITKPLPTKGGAFISPGSTSIDELLASITALAIGPGLSNSDQTSKLVLELLLGSAKNNVPVVLDADGLNCLAAMKNFSSDLTRHCILTPHPGEAAKLLGMTSTAVQRDRYGAALGLMKKFSCTVVLKGPGTIICNAQLGVVNTTGNPMLATAGSGDVLTGIIAGLLGQGLKSFDAAALGVYFHARAADILFENTGGPFIASDIPSVVPYCIGELTEKISHTATLNRPDFSS